MGNALEKMSIQPIIDFLAKNPLFGFLDTPVLSEIAYAFEFCHIGGRKVVMRQGEEADGLYLVLHGRLQIYKENTDEQSIEIITEIGQGEIVDEMALLIQQYRTTSVRTIRDSILLHLTKSNFDQFIQKYPTAMLKIADICIRRLLSKKNSTTKSVSKIRYINGYASQKSLAENAAPLPISTKTLVKQNNIKTITFIPAGNNPVFKDFSAKLVKNLAKHFLILHLTHDSFDKLHGENAALTSIRHARIVEWLQAQAEKYQFVINETNITFTTWSERCLRQADHTLLIGHHKGLLWKTVRSSISLPRILPPVSNDKGNLLVDGDIINNLPVDLVKLHFHSSITIAVDLMSHHDQENCHIKTNEVAFGWEILWNKIHGYNNKGIATLPSILDTIINSMVMSSRHHQQAMGELVNLCLHIDVGNIGILDFKNLQGIVNIGYETAMRELKETIFPPLELTNQNEHLHINISLTLIMTSISADAKDK